MHGALPYGHDGRARRGTPGGEDPPSTPASRLWGVALAVVIAGCGGVSATPTATEAAPPSVPFPPLLPLPSLPPGAPTGALASLAAGAPDRPPMPPEIAEAARACEDGRAETGLVSLMWARPGPGLPEDALGTLTGVCAVAAGRPEVAEPRLAAAVDRGGPLVGDLAVLLGDARSRAGDREGAVRAWLAVPPSSWEVRQAAIRAAGELVGLGRHEEALARLDAADTLAPGPHRPGALLLRARALAARGRPDDAAAAWDAAQEVWSRYPASAEAPEATRLRDALTRKVPDRRPHALADLVVRAESYEDALLHDEAIATLGAKKADLAAAPGDVGCRGMYTVGRALQRQRKYTEALPWWDGAARACTQGDLAVKSAYLRAQALWRTGDKPGARDAYRAVAGRWPEHSYADDSLLLAAAVSHDRGEWEEADADLLRAVEGFPSGDTRGDALWKLAWSRYRRGDVAGASAALGDMRAGYPKDPHRDLALRARYWSARVKGWPGGLGWEGSGEGRAPSAVPREESLAELAGLARDAPLSYYGAMAFAVLRAEAPGAAAAVKADLEAERARALAEPRGESPGVEADFAASAPVAEALAWEALGLSRRAARAWQRALDERKAGNGEPGVWVGTLLHIARRLEAAGDFQASHGVVRRWLTRHHPERPSGWGLDLLRAGYPRAFAAELATATRASSFPPLAFQGLIREESAFDVDVVSWAGAIGLSQLMWPTAQRTAKRLGIPLAARDQLKVAGTNLRIGAGYFQALYDEFGGHVPLCAAGYNAGEGAVRRWLRERPGWSIDAVVEEIPYTQTREYVERVVGSWQTYSYLYGDGGPFVPLALSQPGTP